MDSSILDFDLSDEQAEVDEDQFDSWLHDNDPTFGEHPEPSGWFGDEY